MKVELDQRVAINVDDISDRMDEIEASIDLLWRVWIAPLWDEIIYLRKLLEKHGVNRSDPFLGTMDDVKRRLVTTTLEMCGGNKMAAARRLHINTKTLYNLLVRWERRGAS